MSLTAPTRAVKTLHGYRIYTTCDNAKRPQLDETPTNDRTRTTPVGTFTMEDCTPTKSGVYLEQLERVFTVHKKPRAEPLDRNTSNNSILPRNVNTDTAVGKAKNDTRPPLPARSYTPRTPDTPGRKNQNATLAKSHSYTTSWQNGERIRGQAVTTTQSSRNNTLDTTVR